MITGTVGINYSHELMHQKNALERWLGDILLAMVLYSHFRSEHLMVHHRYVGTPRDPVTARYNEGFHRFYPRVLIGSLKSSFRAEKEKLAKTGRALDRSEEPVLALLGLAGAHAGSGADRRWLGGAFAVHLAGWRGDLAAGDRELCRTLRADTQTPG